MFGDFGESAGQVLVVFLMIGGFVVIVRKIRAALRSDVVREGARIGFWAWFFSRDD